MRELDTIHIPHQPLEVAYALNRWDHDRTPVPKPGDRVYYRRHMWDQNPTLATVLAVADLEDRNDPNLWHEMRDQHGQLTHDGGVLRMVRAPDPLPWVDLEPDDAVEAGRATRPARCDGCDNVHSNRVARTWEARVRGMPGWLPLDWRDRDVKPPWDIVMRPIEPAHVRWAAEQTTHP